MWNNLHKRGVKFVGAAIRGAKHIPKHLKDIDNFMGKAADTMDKVGNFAAIASTEFGNDRLRDASNRLLQHSTHIHNIRNGPTANAVRNMIDAPQNRGQDSYWTPPFANSDM